ncbi:formate dehydrogenase subunit alpha [Francisella halioticida]|uniref:Formate dehydrogenase n=1 Tax=Francisella halioticida TaxID=549298 RepID=A0ABN5B0E5_9GAMM|nr:FdhF/YdeP family oxidoreductase [Francisella halioticida]ASG67165.1 formate dehydrogenase [Francisella halioticida]BCD92132.1 formate dehydrogenase subunit alpha [Francisella halioticida]
MQKFLDNGQAVGEGHRTSLKPSHKDYKGATGSWGASFSVGNTILKAREPVNAVKAIFKMNHGTKGFDCPGCAWPDDQTGLKMDICENGIKHATWEMTKSRCDPNFFEEHTVSELREWSCYDLEKSGRLTHPMQYNSETDRYEKISWDEALKLIGNTLQSLNSPDEASFYTSGRLSNEGTFLYQLLTREYGTNNQPDCSNMCHEASGRALKASIGTGKGTVDLQDWHKTDAIFLIGTNSATNSPRMLTALTEAVKHSDTEVVHINPLIEGAARKAITPHEIKDMMLLRATKASTLDVQVRIAGDLALLRGMSKALIEMSETDSGAIDYEFLRNHTSGYEEYERICRATSWEFIIEQSGIDKDIILQMTKIYRESNASIFAWCLGLTQHDQGVDTIREVVNVLLLRGNIAREGAGPCPIRGHSNVQGNRTLGINNRPSEQWLKRMDDACGIVSPRKHGYGTVDTVQAMMKGDVKVFFGLGGNFAKAAPDPEYTAKALNKCELTVQISTKLNHSHLIHGKKALILPCLARSEIDMQENGVQGVTVEDSMSMVHISKPMKKPINGDLLSEVAIIAEVAKATLPDTKTPWDEYAADYDVIRDKISEAIEGFEDFNNRVREPLGFRLNQPARELVFLTPTGKAEFSHAKIKNIVPKKGYLMLSTMRSHDQWNTTVYTNNDRYRGIKNIRTVIFMNEEDLTERGLSEFDLVEITSIDKDGKERTLKGFSAIKYNIPRGSTMGYMPEMTALCSIVDFSPQSDQALFKEITVRVTKQQ